MNWERTERILQTIDRLGVVSVKQLHAILRMGSYRNTCLIIKKLEEYLNVDRGRQKVVYLNKEGRQMIGSNREVKKSVLFEHMLLANDVYIHYGCPADWKREFVIEINQDPTYDFGIQIKGLTVVKKKTIIPDAVFTRDGFVHLVEIDNTRTMQDNRKKIQKYLELWPDIRKRFGLQPKLCVFTTSEKRKKEFLSLCEKIPSEVFLFNEI